MTNKLALIIFGFLRFISIAQTSECDNLYKSIEDYEKFYNSINVELKETKERYSKAFLVASDLCSCDKSGKYSISLSISLLKKIKQKKDTLNLNSVTLMEALNFCEDKSLLLVLELDEYLRDSGSSAESSFYGGQDIHRLKIEYSVDDDKTTDVSLMTAEMDSIQKKEKELLDKYLRGEITAEMMKIASAIVLEPSETILNRELSETTLNRIEKILETFE